MTDPGLDSVVEAILLANDRFYRALSLADLAAMSGAWLDSDDAACTHPGWPVLRGWEAIHESWRRMFAQQGVLRVWATQASVRVYGLTAEVTCLENVDAGRVSGRLSQARAINLFRKVNDRWRMLEHHAVPLAEDAASRVERFALN